jgi:hypothetical protein
MKCTYCTKDHDSDYICDEMFGGFAKFTANQIAQANATHREDELTADLAAARSEVERLTKIVQIKERMIGELQDAYTLPEPNCELTDDIESGQDDQGERK